VIGDPVEPVPHSHRLGLAALSRTSLVYALGGLAYKGVALLTVPLLARLLSPTELGLLDLAAVFASLLGLIAVMGTDQAVAYYEPRAGGNDALWSSALVLVGALGIGLAIGAVLFRDPIAAALTGDSANSRVVVAAALYAPVIAFTSVGLNAVRLRATAAQYAIASFLLIIAEMAVALAIAIAGGPVHLMVGGWALGAAVVLLPILFRYLPRMHGPRRATAARLAAYGAPLVPMVIAWLVGDGLIRATLAREAELATIGEYGIAYRIASVLGLVVTGFGVAWYPYLFRAPGEEQVGRASNAFASVLLLLAALGVVLTALSPELILVVAGPDYADARHAVGPLAAGMVALGAFTLVGGLVGTSGSTRRIAAAAFVGVVVQFAVANAFVPKMELVGAALASLSGYGAAAILLALTERRLLSGHRGVAVGGAVLLAAAGFVAAAVARDAVLPMRLAVAIGFAAAVAFVVVRLNAVGGSLATRG
jgi:O-antigen/teichoic acid export membrane protein